jgi:Predicted sugar kinase
MDRLTDRKIILITRKTRLENLIVRYNTIQQAQFVIEHSGNDFTDYLDEDRQYKNVLTKMLSVLERLGNLHVLDRDFVPNYIFGKEDIVIAIGQDGLVANTMKYLDSQPLIGVNPDQRRWDGVLLPFNPSNIEKVITDVFRNQRKYKEITLAQVDLSDGQSLFAVNDFFIGQRTHVSARYTIDYNGHKEQQSSSGIIVSTGLGSTGWFKSILAGASGVAATCINNKISLRQQDEFTWDSNFLYYSVREPYPSKWTSANLVFGRVDATRHLKVMSQMPENGVIFSDGVENDYLDFNSGAVATIKIANKKGVLVV